MRVSTAPPPTPTVKTLQKQWLEAMAAYYYVLLFLFVGPFFSLLLFLLFTSLWLLSVLYSLWLFLDRDTPNQAGEDGRAAPNWNYVLVSHPHGIMSTGTFCNFSTECNGASQMFPGIRLSVAGLASLFYYPVLRDYILWSGLCSVARQSLDFILSWSQLGQAVVILVGGAQESLYAIQGQHYLTLQNHKGFVRLALRHGASLVPVYNFGENDIFRLKAFATDSWQYLCQITFKKCVGFSPCIFWGHSLFSNSWGLLPFTMPITTVVGHPILVPQCLSLTQEEVDHYHMLYMKALEQLSEEHKESYGVPAAMHLTFM